MDCQMETAEIIAQDREHSSGALSAAPVAIVRGAGVWLWDPEGTEYLDCGSGIGVAALGHAHPALVAAIADQAKSLMTCASGYYFNDLRSQLASKLTGIAPDGLERVFFSNSGTEAVETAIKLACATTGRPKVVAAMRGFHGRTLGALATTWKPSFRTPFASLLSDATHIPYNDVERLTDAVDATTAAVILEPIQGEGGIYPATSEFLRAARALCNDHGALLIFDEVQSGMGRTGRWFACEHYGITPDILCIAKALGGGVPIGATLFHSALQFAKGQHGSTFGGNPLSCRAALAVVDAIEQENLLDHISDVGSAFLDKLRSLQEERPERIREVRGMGLMLALELRSKAGPILKALEERGILALSGGSTVVRFLPPYIFTHEDVDRVMNVLAEVLR